MKAQTPSQVNFNVSVRLDLSDVTMPPDCLAAILKGIGSVLAVEEKVKQTQDATVLDQPKEGEPK